MPTLPPNVLIISFGNAEHIERARRAADRFRRDLMKYRNYARVITRNPKIRVAMTTGTPCTDGQTIYLRPPIQLGDDIKHDRMTCGQRDERLQLICPACLHTEDVMVTLYHEIAHICENSFDPVPESEKKKIIEDAVKLEAQGWSESRTDKLIARLDKYEPTWIGTANKISPFLGVLVNALEDARVNQGMWDARTGTKKMFDSQTIRVFEDGIEGPSGDRSLWKEAPPNGQAVIAVYCKTSGLRYTDWLNPDIVQVLDDPSLDRMCAGVVGARSPRTTYQKAFPILERLRELGFCKMPDDPRDEPEPEPDFGEGDPSDDDSDPSESDSEDAEAQAGDTDNDDTDSEDEPKSSDTDESDDDSESEDGKPQPGSGSDEEEENEDTEESDDESSSGADDEDDESDDGESDDESSDTSTQEQDDEDEADSEKSDSADSSGSDDDFDDEDDEDEDDWDSDEEDYDDEGFDADSDEDIDASNASNPPESDSDDDAADEPDATSDPLAGSGGAGTDPGTLDTPDPDSDADTSDKDADEDAEEQVGDTFNEEEQGEFDGTNPQYDPLPPEPPTTGDPSQDGTAEEVENLMKVFGRHGTDGGVVQPGSDEEEAELNRAIVQGEYFDSPSRAVYGVNVHEYDKHIVTEGGRDKTTQLGWKLSGNMGGDVTVPEQILAPALLKARIAFADNRKARHQNNLKSGKVNAKVLARRVPVDDERLFNKKKQPGKKDYFVVIGLDISGSTNRGNLLQIIKKAAMAKAELMHRLGVPFAVYAHSGSTHQGTTHFQVTDSTPADVDIFVVKAPHEAWSDVQRKRLRELTSCAFNLDGHTLEFYRKVAERQQATDKIILYYTDGAMPLENYEEELEVLQREIRYCKMRKIHLMGVAIKNSDPEAHGLDTVRLDSIEDVGKVVKALEVRLTR